MKLSSRLSEATKRLVRREPEPQVCVVSYPKCGRTWLRLLVGKALCEQYGLPEAKLFKTLQLSRAAKVLPTKFVHDGIGGMARIRWHEQDKDKSRFADKRVALLIRDPRDVVVSAYFYATKQMHVYEGSMPEFIRDECFGIRTILTMYEGWQEHQGVPLAFLLLRYEDMHRDPAACLCSLLAFMGVEKPDEGAVAAAIRNGAFEDMQRLERSGSFGRKLCPGDREDVESYKVRKGKVGGFADYLSPDDLDFVERAIDEFGDPFGARAGASGSADVSPARAPRR